MEGKWIYYDRNGIVIKEVYYENGRKQKVIRFKKVRDKKSDSE